MSPINISAIEQQAREMRAEEMRRLSGVFADRLRLMAGLLGSSISAAVDFTSEALRPLFSWAPEEKRHP